MKEPVITSLREGTDKKKKRSMCRAVNSQKGRIKEKTGWSLKGRGKSSLKEGGRRKKGRIAKKKRFAFLEGDVAMRAGKGVSSV